MQDKLNEKLSLLLDDELESQQALSLISKIKTDADLRGKFQRYQLISQAIKKQDVYPLDEDFVGKIQQRLHAEPTYLVPVKPRISPRQKALYAIAASLLLAVVWLVSSQQQPASDLYQVAAIEQPAAQAQIDDYLQAHDNSVYVSHRNFPQAYTRVVGYQQE
ncbi:MAG: sigma-E factor negative regulatory protein [Methylomonas sp.]